MTVNSGRGIQAQTTPASVKTIKHGPIRFQQAFNEWHGQRSSKHWRVTVTWKVLHKFNFMATIMWIICSYVTGFLRSHSPKEKLFYFSFSLEDSIPLPLLNEGWHWWGWNDWNDCKTSFTTTFENFFLLLNNFFFYANFDKRRPPTRVLLNVQFKLNSERLQKPHYVRREKHFFFNIKSCLPIKYLSLPKKCP